MARGTIDDGAVRHVLAVVDEDGPQVNKPEEEDIGNLLQRENKREDVVGHALGPAVERVESVRGKGRGHDPLVVRLVESAVDERVVQTAVNPVDEEIGEEDEDGELEDAVVGERLLGDGIVKLGVASDLEDEKGCSEKGHGRHGGHGLLDFQGDLALEELGVIEGGFVPNEDVRGGCDDEVYQKAEDPIIGKSCISF